MPVKVMGSAMRELYDVLRAATATHRRLRDHVLAIVMATLGVDALCTLLAFLLERGAQQSEVKTIGSAAFWATTQLLTVSSQLKNPISTGGRLLDVDSRLCEFGRDVFHRAFADCVEAHFSSGEAASDKGNDDRTDQ